jgi:hypothetical protein
MPSSRMKPASPERRRAWYAGLCKDDDAEIPEFGR